MNHEIDQVFVVFPQIFAITVTSTIQRFLRDTTRLVSWVEKGGMNEKQGIVGVSGYLMG
jgi:hypothetical protein